MSREEDLPLYKHFSALYQQTIAGESRFGVMEESKRELFCKILSADIESEKRQREFFIGNIFQMLLVALISTTVLWLTINFFHQGSGGIHLFAQLIAQILGGFVFYLGLRIYRKRLYSSFFSLNEFLQRLIIFIGTGMCTKDVLNQAGYAQFFDNNYIDSELMHFKSLIIQSINDWQESGMDCESGLISVHHKMEHFLHAKNKKMESAASLMRLIVMAVFFLSSYLINIVILLQTYISDSFYTPST